MWGGIDDNSNVQFFPIIKESTVFHWPNTSQSNRTDPSTPIKTHRPVYTSREGISHYGTLGPLEEMPLHEDIDENTRKTELKKIDNGLQKTTKPQAFFVKKRWTNSLNRLPTIPIINKGKKMGWWEGILKEDVEKTKLNVKDAIASCADDGDNYGSSSKPSNGEQMDDEASITANFEEASAKIAPAAEHPSIKVIDKYNGGSINEVDTIRSINEVDTIPSKNVKISESIFFF